MEKNKDVSKQLKDHEKRISALEKLLNNDSKPKIKGVKQSLSDYIITLRDSSFFTQPKTAEETHAKLVGKYSCKLNRVEVALLRLAERKQLRKASKIINKKEYKAYTW